MSYLFADRQPCSREEVETGQAEPKLPDAGVNLDAGRSNVIPLPAIAPPEIEPQAWQPPKEVIWMGHRQRVLALSAILLRRLSEPDSLNTHTGTKLPIRRQAALAGLKIQ